MLNIFIQTLPLYLYEMCHDLCTLLGLLGIQYFLHCPETGVIEALGKRNYIRRHHMLIFLCPGTAAQLIGLYQCKDRKVQQCYLISQHLGGYTQRTQYDRIQLLYGTMRGQGL